MSNFNTETRWQSGPDDCEFFTKRWIPLRQRTIAKLIFLHGFVEHISRYDHVFSRYADAGIEVFAFDQRGFGRTAAKTKTQGKTSWAAGLRDADFFIDQEATPSRSIGLNVFLMGHISLSLAWVNQGGGLAFAYTTRHHPFKGLALITGGLILSSPLITQTPGVAASGALIRIGSFIGAVLPQLTLKVGVSAKDISRDPVVQEQYSHDPLCAPIGTFKGVADMILGGENLLSHDYKLYPARLPLLAVHGTADMVTYHDDTRELIEKINAHDKTFHEFEGFYHEMHNEIGEDKWKEISYIISWISSHQ